MYKFGTLFEEATFGKSLSTIHFSESRVKRMSHHAHFGQQLQAGHCSLSIQCQAPGWGNVGQVSMGSWFKAVVHSRVQINTSLASKRMDGGWCFGELKLCRNC